MKYFTDCKTIEDVKATYHKLVKALHPDNGDDKKTRRRGRYNYNMDGLRTKWGSTTVKNEKQEKLA